AQAGELFLARGASFHVPREAVPFRRGQSFGQQAGECLVGGAGTHEMAPRALGRKCAATQARSASEGRARPSLARRACVAPARHGGGHRSGGHEAASSFRISSWSIFCTLLLAT